MHTLSGGGDAEPTAQQAEHGLLHEWRHDGVAAVLGTIVSPLFTTGGGDAEPAAQQAEHGLLYEWGPGSRRRRQEEDQRCFPQVGQLYLLLTNITLT